MQPQAYQLQAYEASTYQAPVLTPTGCTDQNITSSERRASYERRASIRSQLLTATGPFVADQPSGSVYTTPNPPSVSPPSSRADSQTRRVSGVPKTEASSGPSQLSTATLVGYYVTNVITTFGLIILVLASVWTISGRKK